jgi:hypothetical protein
MALDWKWIGMSAALTLGILAGPLLASAAAADSSRRSYSSYTPSAPTPPVKPQFNNAASAPPKPRPSNASGSAAESGTQNGKPNAARANQPGAGTSNVPAPKPNAQAQALMEAFRKATGDSRNVRHDREDAPAPSNQPKPVKRNTAAQTPRQ